MNTGPPIYFRSLLPRFCCLLLALGLAGCRTSEGWRRQADDVAARIISSAQTEAVGRTEPVTVDSPRETLRAKLLQLQDLPHTGPLSRALRDPDVPDPWNVTRHLPSASHPEVFPILTDGEAFRPSLLQSIQIAARNSREFQDAKDDVFRTALDLDLERDEFRTTLGAVLSGFFQDDDIGDERRRGILGEGDADVSRQLRNGTELAGAIAVDLVRLLTQDRSSSLGLVADASISIPLLRGAGRDIVEEPLRQAERNMLYAVWNFERFKREFAVALASDYLGVLLDLKKVENQSENYRRLVLSTRRARRLADAGQRPEFEFDQAVQNELRARDNWISARQTYERSLDRFKISLGLPPDVRMELCEDELERLKGDMGFLTEAALSVDYSGPVPAADAPVELEEPTRDNAGPLEMDMKVAIEIALENRCDLLVAHARVEDAQRDVMVAADALRPGLTLLGTTEVGESRGISSADSDDVALAADKMTHSALLELDLPLERTSERNAYRESIIGLESATRDFQNAEDQIKLQVRDRLRSLALARESVVIQAQAVELARKRVHSTDLFLQAGRAAIRDLLEAQEDLLNAQNSLVSALVSYRTSEWALQRDMGVLQVTVDGLWKEFTVEN